MNFSVNSSKKTKSTINFTEGMMMSSKSSTSSSKMSASPTKLSSSQQQNIQSSSILGSSSSSSSGIPKPNLDTSTSGKKRKHQSSSAAASSLPVSNSITPNSNSLFHNSNIEPSAAVVAAASNSALLSKEYNELISSLMEEFTSNKAVDNSQTYQKLTHLLQNSSNITYHDKIQHIIKQLLNTNHNAFQRSVTSLQKIKKQLQNSNAKKLKIVDSHLDIPTAQKIRQELTLGMSFCASLIQLIHDVLEEFGHPIPSGCKFMIPEKKEKTISSPPPQGETVAEGNPNGSTLRKHRTKSNSQASVVSAATAAIQDSSDLFSSSQIQLIIDQSLTNSSSNMSEEKKLSKKETIYRYFELIRFRTLYKGDYVAAKLSPTRDLYICMRVVQDWSFPHESVPLSDLLTMSEAKKANLFKQKVLLCDVEDYASEKKQRPISRYQILPLPRSYVEASDWTTKCRKGYRVYAMYPKTTSLYCATVVDNTTYCREDDDIVVVEFDGDEDDYNKLPQRHIPGRFVVLMPQSFPNSKVKRKRAVGNGITGNTNVVQNVKKELGNTNASNNNFDFAFR